MKHTLILVAAVVVGLIVYDKFIKPMIAPK